MNSNQTTAFDQIMREVEQARVALNSTPWWRFIKRQDAGHRYRYALLAGALWEVDHGIQPAERYRTGESSW